MEIYTGIDIVENERIEKVYKKFKDKFLNKIFTEREIEYCLSKKDFIPCISARFACKEAVFKAFYQAFEEGISFKKIEVLGKENKPATVILHKKIDKNFNINVSISHEKKFSTAVAIIYIE